VTPEQQKALALAKARKRKKQKLEQSTLSGMVDSFTNQAVGGLGPILTAGEAAVLGRTPEGDFFNFEESMSKRFNDALAAERAQNEQFNEDHFIASTAAGIPGAVVAGGGVGAVGRKVAPKVANTLSSSLPGRLVAGAGAGSALGAGNAVGQGKDVVTNAVVGAASGLAGQAAGEVLTRGGSAAIGALRRKPKIPTVEKLRDAQQAAYRIAGQQDILYSQTAIRGLRDKVMRQFAKRGFHPSRHPGAADVIEELNRLSEAQLVAGQGITTARKLFNDAWKAGKKENNSLVGAAVREMDNMIRNPKSAVHGDAKVFSKHLRAGNEASRRLFKLEEADELSSRAGRRAARTGSGGNVENTTRQELSKILDQAKRSRSFKPDELEVIEKNRNGYTHAECFKACWEALPRR